MWSAASEEGECVSYYSAGLDWSVEKEWDIDWRRHERMTAMEDPILRRRMFDSHDFYTVGNELMIFDLINLKKRRTYVD